MSDTPRSDTFFDAHLDFGYYESNEWHKFASLLELDLNRALSAIRELLNDGCDYPNPHTGDAEQFRADVGSIAAWLEETEAKSKACADSFNPTLHPPGCSAAEPR